ncbi:ATP synthase subunit a [Bacteroidia bacterium]|nr:ATP synthase subunit a [Bacteroidia bacterium]GHT01885.1 ATP synthase subunit a [Bacteroidia bacterium]
MMISDYASQSLRDIYKVVLFVLLSFCSFQGNAAQARNDAHEPEAKANEPVTAEHEPAGELNVRELILEHIGDEYGWHVTTVGGHDFAIPLPVIVQSKATGEWHVFSSAHLHGGHEYEGFSISHEEPYKGKIVEHIEGIAGQARNDSHPNGQAPNDSHPNGQVRHDGEKQIVRPLDLSITKVAFSLILCSLILIVAVLYCARWYRKRQGHPEQISPSGFIAFMEMVIMSVVDDIAKPCIGKNYKRYTPYLLTVFFFIIFINLVGLIPFFPGGANVTGNIAITCVLALCTFFITNLFGTKEYWKEIFLPDVPHWLKPIMAPVEFLGILTKPFALMIRLFASILAGHALLLGLTCIVFLTVRLGVGINAGMTVFSVLLSVFSNFVELLVAYIQAYVFTMLSAIYFGLSQAEPHHQKHLD